MNSMITSQIAIARHQEMLARAEQRRLAKQAIAQARELWPPERRERRPMRLVQRLRARLAQ